MKFSKNLETLNANLDAAGENLQVFKATISFKNASICAPQARFFLEISKPYFQISLKFEKSQNRILNFRKNMKNLKTLMQDSKLEFSKSQNHESRGRRRRP